MADMARLQRALGYRFLQPDLLELALTHSSAGGRNNERLEFLGDSVLNHIMAEALYRRFPGCREGELSRMRAALVNGETLAAVGNELELGSYLRLGSGERKSGGHRRGSIIADAFEAVIGAILLDSDVEACRGCVLALFARRLQQIEPGAVDKDAKTQLQEYLQGLNHPLPEYELLEVSGKDHARQFRVACNPRGGAPAVARRNRMPPAWHWRNWPAMGSELPRRCGYVAIVGRPNVGKSTLLNHLLGQKISITSRKPQTTRHRLLGIKTGDNHQIIYVDTPGLHLGGSKAINRYMNREASSAIHDVDVLVFLVDRTAWTEEDESVLDEISRSGRPVLLAVNKVDLLEDKALLLPHLERLAAKADFAAILPVSALKQHNVEALEERILEHLPQADFFFPEDQLTDRSQRFLAAEIVREKIIRQLGDELPYAITVEIEEFTLERGVLHISAVIFVERKGQKKILIGEKGARLRSIGKEARLSMEALFDSKVMLRLWVKIKSGWSDDERALRSLGYSDH
jgi:GTP-binding protein Era